jgi:hypothetical protein
MRSAATPSALAVWNRRDSHIGCALAHFIEQAGILDSDDCLGGEVLD